MGKPGVGYGTLFGDAYGVSGPTQDMMFPRLSPWPSRFLSSPAGRRCDSGGVRRQLPDPLVPGLRYIGVLGTSDFPESSSSSLTFPNPFSVASPTGSDFEGCGCIGSTRFF